MPAVKSIIDSQQIRVYVTLARLLNMSRTAEELRLTPSAVSHCLKTLESDLGCRLFERTSRQMALSEMGREFLIEAEDILERMKALRNRIRSRIDWKQGQLRIGASTTACQFILPPALREFRESFPDFTVKIEPCTSRQAFSYLQDDRLDLALLIEPLHHDVFDFKFLAEDDLQFVVHPLHPWAVKRKVLREDVPKKKLIVPERSGDTYALIEAYFRREGLEIEPFVEIASEEAIKNFVHLDMGVGILPRWIAAEEIDEGSLVALPLGRRRLTRRWGILHSKARKLTFAESVFISVCRDVLRSLVAERTEPAFP